MYLNNFLRDFDNRLNKTLKKFNSQNIALEQARANNPLIQNYPPSGFSPQSPVYMWLYQWLNNWLGQQQTNSSQSQSQG